MTIYAEVIGDPIAQSKSPAIHNYWIEELGLDADYRAQLVQSDGLGAYLDARRGDADWQGCNVTMPHKQAVIPLLDRLEPPARRVGAVNTVVKAADGALVGRNTDVGGFLEPLRPVLAKQHYFRMARILGTGGRRGRLWPGWRERDLRSCLLVDQWIRREICWQNWTRRVSITPYRWTILLSRPISPLMIGRGAAI